MGHTLVSLSSRELPAKSIFNNRFVIEVCEKFHMHYRNLRLFLSYSDFVEVMTGMIRSYERWVKLGSPEPKEGQHVELCRKIVGRDSVNEGIKINLNKNLYPLNEGKIFAEGTDFADPTYIHLKVRDIRLELSISDFNVLADAVKEAKGNLDKLGKGMIDEHK